MIACDCASLDLDHWSLCLKRHLMCRWLIFVPLSLHGVRRHCSPVGMLFFSFLAFGREDAPDVYFSAFLPLLLFVPVGRMLVASMLVLAENLSRVTLYVARLRPNGEKGWSSTLELNGSPFLSCNKNLSLGHMHFVQTLLRMYFPQQRNCCFDLNPPLWSYEIWMGGLWVHYARCYRVNAWLRFD